MLCVGSHSTTMNSALAEFQAVKGLPKLTRPKVSPATILLAHDAFKAIKPESSVKAFIKHRRQWNCDVLWQFPGCTSIFEDVIDKDEIMLKLSRYMGSHTTFVSDRNRLLVSNGNLQETISVCVGDPSWTVEMLNKERDDRIRARLRAGLGIDMDEWEHRIDLATHMAAQHCLDWAEHRFAPEARPPKIFWMAHCHARMIKVHDPGSIVGLFSRIGIEVTQRFFTEGELPVRNPAFPEEDLKTIWQVNNLLQAFTCNRSSYIS